MKTKPKTLTGRDKLLIEALKAAKKANYNGIFLLPTGSGKGRLMIEILKVLNPKTVLYLCNSTLLRDKMFKDELAKWDAMYFLPRMDIQCYQTAYKWVGKHYDLLLADEFDASLSPEYINVYKNNTFRNKILVSATLDDTKKIKAKLIAPIVYERTLPQLVANKVLNKVKYYFVNYTLTPSESAMYVSYNSQFKSLLNQPKTVAVEKKLERLQLDRKHFIAGLSSSAKVARWLISSLNKNNEKVLVFCGLNSQADTVCQNSYHSNSENNEVLQKFYDGKITVLSVVGKVDRGVNIEGIKNVVFENIGRSKTKITQRIGRGMRLDVNDTLKVFFIVPHYKTIRGELKPTIVLQWILDATTDLDLSGSTSITYEHYIKKN